MLSTDLAAEEKANFETVNPNNSENKEIVSGENPKSSEEKRVSSEEISSNEKNELQARADQLRKFLNEQNGLSKSTDCNTDIIFVVDRTQRSTFDFSQQLQLADNIVRGISPGDIQSGKIRLSLITFSKKPRVIIPLPINQTLNEFSIKLHSILPSHSIASIEKGINSVIDEIAANRRNDAKIVIVFIASGKLENDETFAFEKAISKFQNINNTDTFALSLNPFNDVKNLEKLTGNKWRVFIDGRVRQFPNEVITSITSCSIASREFEKQNISQQIDNSIEKVEKLTKIAKSLQTNDPFCGSDQVDFVVIFDISTSIVEEFDKQKQLVVNLVKQAPAADFGKRIKFGLTVFNQHAKTLLSLNNSMSKDDCLFAIDRIEHTGGQTSAVTGIGQSLADIQQFRRSDAKLKILIVSDGFSRDGWSRVQKAGNALRKSDAEVFAVTLNKEKSIDELAVYTDSPKKVFTEDKIELFILSAQKLIFECSKESPNPKLSDIIIAHQESNEVENIESLDKIAVELPKKPKPKGPSTTTIHPPLTTTDTIETTTGKPEYSLETTTKKEEEQHIPTLFSDDCSVDLMFIIDTSTSVTNEFQKQLQFAVDLVKRLPSDDFEKRVNVAAVSFFREAKVEFPFGKLQEKSQVLDGLFAIQHVGGSTSAVSGVKLAVDEIIRGRRKGARLMVVLISDGNSQDPWQAKF
uniref:VWFA domain-containing protein n=1 Tax=Panagrolaimus davidi TaxID=227884 RepID=A0A914QHH8_9BILA